MMLFLGFALIAQTTPEAIVPNRLARETSAYLRHHGSNPVSWHPWGPAAFQKAREEGKFVFLSIGYSSCHWCHVMERESFCDPEIATVLNRHFVCIKVDREERPDIDEVYLAALSVTGVSGGWPASLFLTADAKPIFGGTYWPPRDIAEDGNNRVGFLTVLNRVLELTEKDRPALLKQADAVAKLVTAELTRTPPEKPAKLTAEIVTTARDNYEFDPEYGGFALKMNLYRGSKFPRAPALAFLLTQSTAATADLNKSLALTLEKLALSGTRDQLGGGFHRYSTERTWTVPHFEKMLYDQGQLIEVYAASASAPAGDRPFAAAVVADTVRFLERELLAPEGAFYASIDADSEGVEGAFTVWTPAQLGTLLGDRHPEGRALLGLAGKLNFEDRAIVPTLATRDALVSPPDALLQVKELLFAEREKRTKPFRDEKILVAWNGLTIAGLARAATAFDEPRYAKLATLAAEFILKEMRTPDGRLIRSAAVVPGRGLQKSGQAFLDDYAAMTHGLLNLYEATRDKRWLAEAEALTAVVRRDFADAAAGGFFLTPAGEGALFVRGKDHYDGAVPSAAGLTARNLVRLFGHTQKPEYRADADRAVRAFAGPLAEMPQSCPVTADALRLLLTHPETP